MDKHLFCDFLWSLRGSDFLFFLLSVFLVFLDLKFFSYPYMIFEYENKIEKTIQIKVLWISYVYYLPLT